MGLLWDTCPGAGVVAATGEWSVGCEGDNHLCKVWKVYQCLFSYQETLCDGLFIIMIYISPLMSSVCSSLFGCFCSLGCCGVHVLVNTSFLYRIGQVDKFAGFLCLCITSRLWLLVQYLIFILWFSC